MSIQPNELNAGDVLIGQNLLIIPALLLENNNKSDEKKIPLDAGHFHDFCKLVSTLMMSKRLITLPAQIPLEIKDSQLYRYLNKKHLLYELKVDKSDLDAQAKNEIRKGLAGTNTTDEVIDIALNKKFCFCEYIREDKPLDDERREAVHKQRNEFINNLLNHKESPLDFYTYGDDNERLIRYYQLRTAVYSGVSVQYKLPFVPDLIRIPIIIRFHYRIIEGVGRDLQSKIDQSLRQKFKTLLYENLRYSLPIPMSNPVLTFLSKYYETSNLDEAFNHLIGKSSRDRSQIINWEDKIRRAKDVEGVDQAIKEVKSGIGSMMEPKEEEKTSSTILSIILDAGPPLEKFLHDAFTNQVGPDTLSSVAVGVETVARNAFDLYRKEHAHPRLSFLMDAKKESANVADQHELLEHAFGKSFDEEDIVDYAKLADSVEMLIGSQNKKNA